jgi:hypothetical protein
MKMVRIRTIALTFLLASSVTATASAQIVTETNPPAPIAAPPSAPAPAAEEELSGPELPPVPEGLRERVAELGRTVDETAECFTYRAERSEHIADSRCGAWYATLVRGGPASAHAIGAALLRPATAAHRVRDTDGEYQRGPRLVQVMFNASVADALPYALRALSDAARAGEFRETDREILRQLVRATGDDVNPVAPWESEVWSSEVARAHASTAWLRWWRSHQGETRAQWTAAAETRATADLTHPDPAVRFSALQRLARVPAHRAAVTTSLGELLSSPELPARAAVHIRRWAQRARIPVPPAAPVAARPPSLARAD